MHKQPFYITRKIVISGVLVLLGAAGIYYAMKSDASTEAPANQAIPVTVQTMKEQKVRVWTNFSGRLRAVDAAEIRPEVSGRITEIRFEDGQMVKKGDVLLVIEPGPYEAAVARAEANLASAETQEKFAASDKRRAAGIVKKQAISRRTYDERMNAYGVAEAAVKAAEAELKQANLDLDHAFVKAPIGGRVSRAEITEGNLVQSGAGAPLLTTIVANEEIYADFEVDEQTYLQSIRAFASSRKQERKIPVEITVQNDKEHTYSGRIYSFDNRIDPATGTIRARAKFNNEDGTLLPGMYVSVSLASGNAGEQLLIPERALGFDQNKKFVYVVGEGNKVAYREVELGKQVQAQRIVLKGLQPGDKVVVDGVQHIRPETVVDPKEQAPKGQAADGEPETLAKR